MMALIAAVAAVAASPMFAETFDRPLTSPWQVNAGSPTVAPDPDGKPGGVLDMTPGSVVTLEAPKPGDKFVFEARVRFAEKRGWVEAPFLLRADDKAQRYIQIYLEQTGNQVIAVRCADGVIQTLRGTTDTPTSLEIGKWYTVRIVVDGKNIVTLVDDVPVLAITDAQPRTGRVGFRVGDARTYYDNVVLRAPTEKELKLAEHVVADRRPTPTRATATAKTKAGAPITLISQNIAEPGVPFAITVKSTDGGPFTLDVAGQKQAIRAGSTVSAVLSGAEGARAIRLMQAGRTIVRLPIELRASTLFEAKGWTQLFNILRTTVEGDRASHRWRGGVVHTNPTWYRDHVHEMKAYQYWAHDLSSYTDALIKLQHPDGYFYEIVTSPTDEHLTFVKPKHRLVDDGIGWVRLELEADVEYLMVEGVWHIWQATGDVDALKHRLPALEKALTYCFTDPTRWDSEHHALKRTFTIDTWDFTYGLTDRNRKIEPGTPMGIMHGDNSGLYQACRQLATMLRAVGEQDRAAQWDHRADDLRTTVNKLCFNGKYYTHQILLQPVNTGVREEDILSLSNTYDINRGLPTHAMAVSIIDEYQRRRELRKGTTFAEWFSIDPAYPQFGPYPAGHYINGGLGSFVAGELAKAALQNGREAYGADVLTRLRNKVMKDGAIYFLYSADGKNIGGGPSGWSAAAVTSAMLEGLAGIHDDDVLFRKVTVSPRFAAANIDRAYVSSRYGPSGAYCSLAYQHNRTAHRIHLSIAGVANRASVHLLLPAGATDARVVSPTGLRSRIEQVEQSRYLIFSAPSLRAHPAQVTVAYTAKAKR